MKKPWIVLCIGVLAPSVVYGERVYRCVDAGQAPVYQQVPCRGKGGEVTLPEPAARWDALRPGERALLKQRRAKKPRAKAASKRKTDGSALARNCLLKRQRRDGLSAKLRRGYKPSQGERLRRRRDDLDEFIRRYCD